MDTKTPDPALARQILLDAGADPQRVRVEQYRPGAWLVAAPLFGSGCTSDKDEAFDTPQEVAAHLVKHSASERALFDPATVAGVDVAPALDAEAEGGQDAQEPDAPLTDVLSFDTGSPEAGAIAASGDLVSEAPIDADFDLGVFSVEAPPTDGSFLLENRPDDIEVEEPTQREQPTDPGGVAYFGDNIHTIKLAKMGRLSQIARAAKDALQEGWTLAEFASLQNLVVRIDRGEAPDDPEARARFVAISERSAAMARVDAFREQRESELEAAERPGIEAFDPEAGWP